jgi:thioredoxin-like negative regulator of GroEL
MSRLERALAQVDPADRRQLYLTVTREALAKGKIETARFAIKHAVALIPETSPDYRRSRIYEAAVRVVSGEVDEGYATLAGMSGDVAEPDLELRSAAMAVAEEVRRVPDIKNVPGQSGAATASKIVDAARAATVRVDGLLQEFNK